MKIYCIKLISEENCTNTVTRISCAMQGCCDPECGGTNYYYPLGVPMVHLPLCTDYSYSQAITYTEAVLCIISIWRNGVVERMLAST
jgi:hypothetical protein